MEVYPWVSEGSIRKFHRALAQLEKENVDRAKAGQPTVEITEAAIKALYVKWAGLVLGDPSTVTGVAPGDEEAAVNRAAEAQGAKVATKKAK